MAFPEIKLSCVNTLSVAQLMCIMYYYIALVIIIIIITEDKHEFIGGLDEVINCFRHLGIFGKYFLPMHINTWTTRASRLNDMNNILYIINYYNFWNIKFHVLCYLCRTMARFHMISISLISGGDYPCAHYFLYPCVYYFYVS